MDKTEFGKRLRYLRAEAGYTQEKLAELSDMSTVYLGEIERGKKVVGLDKFIKLGLMQYIDGRYSLTLDGINVSNSILCEFV